MYCVNLLPLLSHFSFLPLALLLLTNISPIHGIQSDNTTKCPCFTKDTLLHFTKNNTGITSRCKHETGTISIWDETTIRRIYHDNGKQEVDENNGDLDNKSDNDSNKNKNRNEKTMEPVGFHNPFGYAVWYHSSGCFGDYNCLMEGDIMVDISEEEAAYCRELLVEHCREIGYWL